MVLAKDLNCFRCRGLKMVLAVVANSHRVSIRNTKLHRSDGANSAPFKLPQPLMRDHEIFKHGRCEDMLRLQSPHCVRFYAGFLDAADQTLICEMDELRHSVFLNGSFSENRISANQRSALGSFMYVFRG